MGEPAEHLMLALLKYAKEASTVPETEDASARHLGEALHDLVDRTRQQLAERERTLTEARLERRKLTLQTMHDTRVRAAEGRLQTLEEKRAADFAIRMAKTKLERAQRERERALEELGREEKFTVESEEIAAGIVLVEGV